MDDELNAWFPRAEERGNRSALGTIVSGSLGKGLEAKLAPDMLIEGLAV